MGDIRRSKVVVALPLAAVLLAASACSTEVRPTAGEVRSTASEQGSGHGQHQQHEGARDGAAGQPDRDASRTPAEGTVIQPGKPGDPVETLPPDARLPADRYNDADVEFVRMMIPHHAQALEMGELAKTRAQDAQVQAVASRIADAQGAEILALSAWLQQRGLKAPTAQDLEGHGGHGGAHGHGGAPMPGMLTEAELDELAAARGAEFDRLYLTRMIEHHRGAVRMAGSALDSGRDTLVNEMASEVSAGQTAEIRRMEDLLAGL